MWPSVTYEELVWHIDPDEREFIPKSARRRIASTYRAAVPAQIAPLHLELPETLSVRIGVLLVKLARFDEAQAVRDYDLPALLLRSESAASSQIEHLTSSVRNVALAELTDDAPSNARIVQGNVAAMRTALSLVPDTSVSQILSIHKALIDPTGASFGGEVRQEQVWVGGTAYSPHGALFVPPSPARVAQALDDLVAFAGRGDINPIAKAAIAHAQFETIHPFVDGNGRTGRVLLHRILVLEGVLSRSTLPVSAGLLHDIDAYMKAIESYQQGDPLPIIIYVIEALELALVIGGACFIPNRRDHGRVEGCHHGACGFCDLGAARPAGRAACGHHRICCRAAWHYPAYRIDAGGARLRVRHAAPAGLTSTRRLLPE